MSKITLEDVLDFISSTATKTDMGEIESALDDANHIFFNSQDNECDCTPESEVEAEAKRELLQQIIGRGNQFGLEDMLDELRREGESVGVYLNQGVAA